MPRSGRGIFFVSQDGNSIVSQYDDIHVGIKAGLRRVSSGRCLLTGSVFVRWGTRNRMVTIMIQVRDQQRMHFRWDVVTGFERPAVRFDVANVHVDLFIA